MTNENEEARQELQKNILNSIKRFEAVTGLSPDRIDLQFVDFLSGARKITGVAVKSFGLYEPEGQ